MSCINNTIVCKKEFVYDKIKYYYSVHLWCKKEFVYDKIRYYNNSVYTYHESYSFQAEVVAIERYYT